MARSQIMPAPEQALPGRSDALSLDYTHAVLNNDMSAKPAHGVELLLGLGCFWGAERLFWQLPGVITTAVGYAGGYTPNPSYEEVCTGLTGHTEVVRVVFDPEQITLAALLKVFWEAHDPTQGMQQGNDIGTQYRSAVYAPSALLGEVRASAQTYQAQLAAEGRGRITTEIAELPAFFFAEQYHQQYLHKNPNGYCGLKGTGVVCPI